jgi:hypothetical protein
MTLDDRVRAIESFEFTTRQAAFLTTVMLHAGVCLPRHYTRFAGIAYGRTTRDFFDRLIEERYATAHSCWRRGGAFYHVHHKSLYQAIGEPDNRHRRAITISRAAERLMLLDVVLAHPDVRWLATDREKLDYFTKERLLEANDLPHVTFGKGANTATRYFTDKLPIARARGDLVVFVYLVTSTDTRDFQRFLSAHHTLLRRLSSWTLKLVIPRFLASYRTIFEHTAHHLFSPPLRLAVADEFRWYCHARRALELATTTPHDHDHQRFRRAQAAFGARRFRDTYRAWLQHGDPALNSLISPVLHDAWNTGRARIETEILRHRYLNIDITLITA